MKLTFENFFSAEVLYDLVVIYPGRFQPAHKNHAKVYNFLIEKFPYASVYIATSNKISHPKSPFSFDEKKLMLVAAGVPEDKIIQTVNPYQAREITRSFTPENSKLIFAVGGKDMDPAAPRFNFSPTKKGDAYFKPLPNLKTLTPAALAELYTFDKHGYVATTPTFHFKLNITGVSLPIKSASEIREIYKTASELGKKEIITQLYGRFNEQIYNLFNNKLI
jgi:hypothetical protein